VPDRWLRYVCPRLHAARARVAVLEAENKTLRLALLWRRAQLKAAAQVRIDASTDRLIERVVMAKHVKARTGATR